MSVTVNTGWLKDNNGEKFAPKTLTSQVVTPEGITIESKLDIELDALSSSKADIDHTHSVSNVTNLQVALDEKVPTSRTINKKELSSNITLSASDVNAYSKSEIDDMEYISITSIDTICGSSLNYEYAEEVSF